ncbi:TPA: hypothetical protein ACGQK4_001400 [Elizabethkingia anophelis]|uniref:hypothetical protein n=1 Tax=Elizabethkingia anophelis TaxID=1117645 RepID=UPI0021A79394|nr:hypothetical protein [Elizabethkingia anophelis]
MKIDFPEMISGSYFPKSLRFLQGFMLGIVFIIIATVLLILILLAFTDYAPIIDDTYRFLFFVFFIILTSLAGLLIYDTINNKKRRISWYKINNLGIFFFNKENQLIQKILFNDLTKNPDIYSKDVYSESSGSGKYRSFKMNLCVFEKDANGQVRKRIVDFNSVFVKNKYSLIAHFLKGIKLFRPNLIINADIYKDFYLNENTLDFVPEEFKKDIYMKGVVFGIIALLFIIVSFII